MDSKIAVNLVFNSRLSQKSLTLVIQLYERMNKQVDFIPNEKFEEGIAIMRKNAKSLIETASYLYDTKLYLHSAIFSIFAIEEMAKSLVLKEKLTMKRNLTYNEWDKIVKGKAHLSKLRIYFEKLSSNEELKKEYPNSNTAPANEIMELILNYYLRLKNNVLYVNWDKRLNKWAWFPNYYKETDSEIRSRALLNFARMGFDKL
jgi:AbiV family abortive infection protein